MMWPAYAVILIAFCITGCSSHDDQRPVLYSDSLWAQSQLRMSANVASADSDVFFVTRYDHERDPFEDLAAAVELAQAEDKQILLVVGGWWCGPCIGLERYWAETESIRERLIQNFIVMKVNYGPLNHNERFLSQFAEIHGYPHVFVLDSNGRATIPPVKGLMSGYFDEDRMTAYLDWWTPDSASTVK